MATAITTKGDLVPGTGSGTFARLAVGNNGESIYADSAVATGLRYSATPSASNPVLNSAMQVCQRGTTTTITSTSFVADRWQAIRSVAGATATRQVTGDTTNLPNVQYCLRVARDSGNTSTSVIALGQNMESVNSISFAGKTVTMSFYARAGANFSAASSVLKTYLTSGTGTDQNNVTGAFTSPTQVVNSDATLTTTWQRFTFTGTVPATATQLGPQFQFTPVGTAGANDYFEVTGVQIDIGSVALPFRTYAATIQGELAACQRYYFRIQDGNNGAYGGGIAQSTTQFNAAITTPVTMRVIPTVLDYSALRGVLYGVAGYSISSASISSADSSKNVVIVTCNATGLTQKQFYPLTGDGSGTYIGLGAEL
jgi:hypothetical protein